MQPVPSRNVECLQRNQWKSKSYFSQERLFYRGKLYFFTMKLFHWLLSKHSTFRDGTGCILNVYPSPIQRKWAIFRKTGANILKMSVFRGPKMEKWPDRMAKAVANPKSKDTFLYQFFAPNPTVHMEFSETHIKTFKTPFFIFIEIALFFGAHFWMAIYDHLQRVMIKFFWLEHHHMNQIRGPGGF